MIVLSHVQLSRIIYNQLRKKGLLLNSRSFTYGNIKPDISTMIKRHRHKVADSYDYVCDSISDLANTQFWGDRKNYSYKLGIICHYLTDFFTYAHSAKFSGTFAKHMAYENDIHNIVPKFNNAMKKACLSLHSSARPNDLASLIAYIDLMQELYLNGLTPNPQRDLAFALNVCTVAAQSLVAISSRKSRFAPTADMPLNI